MNKEERIKNVGLLLYFTGLGLIVWLAWCWHWAAGVGLIAFVLLSLGKSFLNDLKK